MPPPDTPLFVKTHDFVVWLFNHTQRFPKSFRHSYTIRLEQSSLDFEEAILTANASRGESRRRWLHRADAQLLVMRSLLRYTIDWKLLGGNQYQYAAEAIDELGRLLGAWLKGTDRSSPARSA